MSLTLQIHILHVPTQREENAPLKGVLFSARLTACDWMAVWRHMGHFMLSERRKLPKKGCLNNNFLPFCSAPIKKN